MHCFCSCIPCSCSLFLQVLFVVLVGAGVGAAHPAQGERDRTDARGVADRGVGQSQYHRHESRVGAEAHTANVGPAGPREGDK